MDGILKKAKADLRKFLCLHYSNEMLGALRGEIWRACRSVNDDLRRRRIISIIRAEMRRRDAVSVENTTYWGLDGQIDRYGVSL